MVRKAAIALTLLCAAAPARAATFNVVYSFNAGTGDAEYPEAALIDVGGTLYGTTINGGAKGFGAVFAVNPATGAEQVVYGFAGGNDGFFPASSLIGVGGLLYGTTYEGGDSNGGTVFAVDPATSTEPFTTSLTAKTGTGPFSSLTVVGPKLYGTASASGAHNAGTVFAVNPAKATVKAVYAFGTTSPDGYEPNAGLVALHGVLYGTTPNGGASGYGSVFSFSPATGAETLVYSFKGVSYKDGTAPQAALVALNGKLYGTTVYGGVEGCHGRGCGTVFSVDPATGSETVLHAFQSSSKKDGSEPRAGLLSLGGKLYGTTLLGGCATGCKGTLFEMTPVSGKVKILYVFNGATPANGLEPNAGVIAVNGTLYGTAEFGGATNGGVVFSYTP